MTHAGSLISVAGAVRKHSPIPVFRPYYDEREEEAVRAVLRSGWIGPGRVTELFEQRFAELVGTRYAVGVSSGTAALQIALRLVGVGLGDDVLVPTVSFVAPASAAALLGARPVLCDVHGTSLVLSAADARIRSPDPKAAIAVLYGGRPVDELDLGAVPIIYDCAHAAGSRWNAAGKLCCWSFNAIKNLTTGEGGMITTDDENLARRAARLRWHGIDRSTWQRHANSRGYSWDYEISEVGFKSPLNDMAAALGLAQLEKLDEMQELRRDRVSQYLRELAGVPGLTLPTADARSSWHLFVVRTEARDAVANYLREHGVDTSVHYRPLHLHPLYATEYRLPAAESEWLKLLTLPLFPGMTAEEVSYISQTVRAALERVR